MPSEDINNLFSRFGSRSGRYQEIVREEQTQDSIGRWPLLSNVDVNEVRDIPAVLAQPLARAAVQAVVVVAAAPTAPAANQQRSELRMVPPVAVAARPAAVARPLVPAAPTAHAASAAPAAPALPLVDSATLGLPRQAAVARPLAERPEDTLRSLFGRLSAPVQPAAAPARPQPAFRRLRHS